MIKKFYPAKLFFFGFIFFLAQQSEATNIGGSEITYRRIDTLTYEVNYTVYRLCAGVGITDLSKRTQVVCASSGKSVPLDPTRVSITDIKATCDSLKPACNPPNQRTGTGLERQVFLDTIDFRTGAFKTLISSGCTDIRFEFYADWASNINTGAASSIQYNYASLDLKNAPDNSSPTFLFDPFWVLVCNQPISKNCGARDTTDDDFITYRAVRPLSGYGKTISSQFPPITEYYLPGTSYPTAIPTANPPVGFYFDTLSGELIMTPSKCQEYTVMCIEAREWRKDTSGKYVNISIIRRDFYCSIERSKDNYPPVIKATFKTKACEGEQLCFDIKTEDTKSPGSSRPDTVRITWDGGIEDASFTPSPDTVLNQSAKFCWTPPVGSSREMPYRFNVEAVDDNCPLPAGTIRSFSVQVGVPARAKWHIDSSGCGQYAVSSQADSTTLTPKYEWAVLDSNGKGLNKADDLAYFNSNGNVISDVSSDYIQFVKPGKFIVRHTVNGIDNCPDVYYDTLVVTASELPTFFKMPADTTVCINDPDMDLSALEDAGAKGGVWSCPGNPSVIKQGKTLLVGQTGAVQFTERLIVYYAFTHPGNGCKTKDSFQVTIHPLAKVDLTDRSFCQDKDTVFLEDDKVIKLPSGATLALGRQAWKCLDCGTYNPSAILEDLGTGGAGAPQDFVLHIDDKTMPLGSKSSDSIVVELEFRSVFGCKTRDTATVHIVNVPKISFSGFPALCWDAGEVNLKTLSQVNPANGTWQAIDDTSYAAASGLNKGLKGDVLNTAQTTRPAADGGIKYLLRYSHTATGCPTYRDTTIEIRGLPGVRISRSGLAINSTSEPYEFCVLNSGITLGSSHAGGTWSCSEPGLLSGNVFSPSNTNKFNFAFRIRYDFTDIWGCEASDSVLVEVNAQQRIQMPRDTAFTWYKDTMSLDVKCEYFNSTGMLWVPLTAGSSVSDTRSRSTTFTFTASPDSVTRHLLYARTDVGVNAVCPSDEGTMAVTIFPDPCIKYDIDYNLAGGTMTLKPLNDLMASYRWEVGDTSTTTIQPVIDVSGFKDSIVWVKLTTVNQLGDSCEAVTKINLRTGSVRALEQAIRIYPNPVEGSFVLDLDAPGLKGVEIFDATGRTVKYVELNGKTVDCSELLPGIYTLKLKHEGQIYLGRFVKR